MTKVERETMAEMQCEMDNLKDEVAGLKMDAMDNTNKINDLMVKVVDLTADLLDTEATAGNLELELDREEEDHGDCIFERDGLQDKMNVIDKDLCLNVSDLEDVLEDLRSLYHSI